jgi:phage-related protein
VPPVSALTNDGADRTYSWCSHGGTQWRLVYRIDTDAIVILEVFAKKTGATPKAVIATCRERLKEYENAGK